MNKKPASQSGLFNPCILVAFTLCSAGVLLAMLSFAATPSSGTIPQTTTTSALVMGIPTIVDPIRAGTEPMIGVNNLTNSWVGGAVGETTQVNWFWHSADGGVSYTLAGPATGHWLCPIGEAVDPSVAIDPVTNDTYLGDCSLFGDDISFARTNENGSQLLSSCNNHPAVGADRPFQVVLHPTGQATAPQFVENHGQPIVYASWRREWPSDPNAKSMAYAWSADGVHFHVADAGVPVDNLSLAGQGIAPLYAPGPMVIDPTTGYLFQAIGCSAASGCPDQPGSDLSGGTPEVGVAVLKPACPGTAPNCPEPASRADSTNIGQFASEDYQTVTKAVAGQPMTATGSPNNVLPAIAMDSAGTLYVLFIPGDGSVATGAPPDQDFHVYYSYSTDRPDHKKWSTPVRVDSGLGSQTAVFPWAVAGDKGRLAVVWLGCDSRDYPGHEDAAKQWHPYVSVITNADTTSPSFHQAQVGTGPNHFGSISTTGPAGTGNPNLADLISISVGPDGAVQATWANDANLLVASTPNTIAGLPIVETSRQVGGPRLIGAGDVHDSRFSSAPTDHVRDATDDALFPRITGSNIPQLDLTVSRIEWDGVNIKIHVAVASLANLTSPNSNQSNVWWLTTWQFGSKIYFAKAESDSGGAPKFTAGVPSVFARQGLGTQLRPTLADYSGGQSVNGALVNGNEFVITVPASIVGTPKTGDLLESVTAFSVLDNGMPPFITPEAANIPDVIDATPAYNTVLGMLTSVVSRMIHGSAGTFDVALPLTGSRGIECRSGGASGDYTLVLTFPNNLTSVASATVTGHDPTSGTGTVSGSPIVGPNASLGLTANQCQVNLTNVSNAQYITVTLNSVLDVTGASGNVVSPQMGVLIGDVTGNGVVTNTDVGAVKAQVNPTTPVTQANFREDVTVNGFVTNTDVGLVKGQVNPTGGLPTPP